MFRNVNIEQVAAELICAIRGDWSQRALARRLGYRSNPIGLWETGKRFPTAAETLRMAEVLGVDVLSAMRRVEPRLESFEATDDAVANALNLIRNKLTLSEVATRLNKSVATIRRWVEGETRPRLPDFLRYIDAINGQAVQLVAGLAEIEQIPSARESFDRVEALRILNLKHPWASGVLRVLETTTYRNRPHEPGFISAVLRLEDSVEEELLTLLQRAGLIAMKDDRYVSIEKYQLYRQPSREFVNPAKVHWTDVMKTRLETLDWHEDDYHAHIVCVLSDAERKELRKKLREAFLSVINVAANNEAPDGVALMMISLANWDPAER